MTASSADVIVAGLGAMGGAAAMHLSRRGVRVLGFDRFAPPHTFGSSHGRTRVIREAYFEDPAYVPLVQRAFTLWRELEADTGADLLRSTGAVMLGMEGSEAIRGTLRSAVAHRLPHERLDAGEVTRRFPALRPAPGMVGLFEPRAGALAVEACVGAQLDAARAAGAELRFDEPILGWRAVDGGVEVETSAGRHSAGALVVALGPWLPAHAPWLPLRVERQVQLWFRPLRHAGRLRIGACPVFLWELPSGEMFYGLPDMGDGVKAARHHGGAFTTPERVNRAVSSADVEEVRHFLARHIPDANGELVEGSVCLYTDAPEGHFILDRHPEQEQVWIVSPCSGHGFKFAPVVGERVAEWVVGGTPADDLARFRVPAPLPG